MNKKISPGTITFGALVMFVGGLCVVLGIQTLLPLAQYRHTQQIISTLSESAFFAGASKPEMMTIAKNFVGEANKLYMAITVYFALIFISGILIIFRKNLGRLLYLFLLSAGLFLDLVWFILIWLIPDKRSNASLVNLAVIFIILAISTLLSFYYFTRPKINEQFKGVQINSRIKKVIFISLLIVIIAMPVLLLNYNNSFVANRFIKEVKIQDPSLVQTVNEYYSLEKEESWNKAYEFRTPNFKQGIPKDFYIAQMKRDNNGWRLVGFKIISVKMTEHNNEAIVNIRFKERTPSGPFSPLNCVITDEETRWKKLNGNWLCVSCGVRSHLNLNAEMVLE